MGQKSKRLRVDEVKWEENGHRSPLLEEILRLLLRRPLTGPDDGAKVLAEEAGTIEEGGDV